MTARGIRIGARWGWTETSRRTSASTAIVSALDGRGQRRAAGWARAAPGLGALWCRTSGRNSLPRRRRSARPKGAVVRCPAGFALDSGHRGACCFGSVYIHLALGLQAQGYHALVFFAPDTTSGGRPVADLLDYRVDRIITASVGRGEGTANRHRVKRNGPTRAGISAAGICRIAGYPLPPVISSGHRHGPDTAGRNRPVAPDRRNRQR